MLETYLQIDNKFFLSWGEVGGGNEYSFLSAIGNNIHGSKQFDKKARKLLKYSLDDLLGLNAYGIVTGQTNDLQQLHYIKHQGSGLRATFFQFDENIFIGVLAFSKQSDDHENEMFEYSASIQENIINWIEENEDLYQEIIQAN